MRQAGVLAAAGLYALDHHVERLADDHARAPGWLAEASRRPVVDPGRVETNIVPLACARRLDAADVRPRRPGGWE